MVWYNMGKINSEKERDMGVIILTGKSCVGKDGVKWIKMVESGK